MGHERVRTDWDSMRTADPNVFAAGDGAFGPSTIVMAMHHGHRAAYYVQKFLEGVRDPLPYRTPFKTRRVPVAQDALWEVFPREHQAFHGLGANPIEFPEIESTYDAESARREAARCYRCDAETGSSDYNVRTREDIFVMARTRPADAPKQRAVFTRRLRVAEPGALPPRGGVARRPRVPAGQPLAARHRPVPRRVPGGDAAGRRARARVAVPDRRLRRRGRGGARSGRRGGARRRAWPRSAGAGSRRTCRGCSSRWPARTRRTPARPRSSPRTPAASAPRCPSAPATASCSASPARRADLPAAIPFALEHELDFLLLEANGPLAAGWPELDGAPDLSVLRDAVRIMRGLNREEDLTLLYAGGVRSGTDTAKLVGMGANAVVVSLALALAVGGQIDDAGGVSFYGDASEADRAEAAALFLSGAARRGLDHAALHGQDRHPQPGARGPARDLAGDGAGHRACRWRARTCGCRRRRRVTARRRARPARARAGSARSHGAPPAASRRPARRSRRDRRRTRAARRCGGCGPARRGRGRRAAVDGLAALDDLVREVVAAADDVLAERLVCVREEVADEAGVRAADGHESPTRRARPAGRARAQSGRATCASTSCTASGAVRRLSGEGLEPGARRTSSR